MNKSDIVKIKKAMKPKEKWIPPITKVIFEGEEPVYTPEELELLKDGAIAKNRVIVTLTKNDQGLL